MIAKIKGLGTAMELIIVEVRVAREMQGGSSGIYFGRLRKRLIAAIGALDAVDAACGELGAERGEAAASLAISDIVAAYEFQVALDGRPGHHQRARVAGADVQP